MGGSKCKRAWGDGRKKKRESEREKKESLANMTKIAHKRGRERNT